MTDFKDSFKVLRHDLVLSDEERSRMREAFMAPSFEPAPPVRHASPYMHAFPWQRSLFAFTLFLAIVAGGATATAGGALPGDVLYGVKLGVNERFERIAAIGTVAKAEVDIRHAEERIQEVELLAAKGTRDLRPVDSITQSVAVYLERANESAKTLTEEGDVGGAVQVVGRMNAALSAHAEILEAQAENETSESRRKLRALSVALSVSNEAYTPKRDYTEARTTEYYERIAKARAEEAARSLASLEKALSGNGISKESIAELAAEHADIEASFASAAEQEAQGDFKEASEAYETLAKRAYRASALLSSAKRIANETEKEVVVGFNRPPAAKQAAPETAMMMLSTEAALEADDTESEMAHDGPTLRFLIRERSR